MKKWWKNLLDWEPLSGKKKSKSVGVREEERKL